MVICLKNFIVIIVMIVLLLAAVEITKYRQGDRALKLCHAEKTKLRQECEQRLHKVYTDQNGAVQKQAGRAMELAAQAKREAEGMRREQQQPRLQPRMGGVACL